MREGESITLKWFLLETMTDFSRLLVLKCTSSLDPLSITLTCSIPLVTRHLSSLTGSHLVTVGLNAAKDCAVDAMHIN